MIRSFNVADIAKITAGELLQSGRDVAINSLITDSRKLSNIGSAAFFAIKGINHDGHAYIPELIEAGVSTFIVETAPEQHIPNDINLIKVNSSLKALQAMARHKRDTFAKPVVGITGSNGKTIVKEWLSKMLSQKQQVIKSPRSYNSQLGVALSVWEIAPEFDIGVFEAGISQPGEMDVLQSIIRPTHGILTNIGTAHEEGFPSIEIKLREKLRLFSGCEWLIYRSDDPLIRETIDATNLSNTKCLSWALEAPADIKVAIEGERHFHFQSADTNFQLRLPFTDAASVENLIHCICCLYTLQFSPLEIQQSLDELEPVDMRLKLNRGINQTYVIDDSYNNDLVGLETALDFLQHQHQYAKKTVILSDLPQVREKQQLYKRVNQLLVEKQVDRLIGLGPEIVQNKAGFTVPSFFYADTNDFLSKFDPSNFEQEVILVKGARKFEFERVVRMLSEQVHQTVFEINLDAITHNLNYYRNKLGPGVKTMVMVKAFAYGSGSAEIAQLLQFHKVHYLSVAYTDEGVTLRKNGIHLPIMVMNTTNDDFDPLIKYRLEPEVFSLQQLSDFSHAYGQRGKSLPVHINFNTGMNRLGFEPHEADSLIDQLKDQDIIEVKSVFTHLAGADEEQHNDFSIHQLESFRVAASKLEHALGQKLLKHALNSAGIQRFPQHQFDMVRLGIGLYGLEASGLETDKLMTVGTLKTVVSQIKEVKAGESIGYGRKGLAENDMTIATVAIGYADGFTRAFSNGNGAMLVNGQLAPVIGNVCMDMCMLEISGIDVKPGDEVTVFGKSPSIQDLADRINTIPYEILTNVSERVKRIYLTE